MLIFLTGFMGSGKTTAGRMLADRMGYGFADTDELLEEREGLSVSRIFALKGEEYFRKEESAILDELLRKKDLVVACGGGTPCFHGNMQKMKTGGVTVYLKVSPHVLARRLSGHTTRPLVAGFRGKELDDHIRKLLSGRESWYRQAHIIYNADEFDVNELHEFITNITG